MARLGLFVSRPGWVGGHTYFRVPRNIDRIVIPEGIGIDRYFWNGAGIPPHVQYIELLSNTGREIGLSQMSWHNRIIIVPNGTRDIYEAIFGHRYSDYSSVITIYERHEWEAQ